MSKTSAVKELSDSVIQELNWGDLNCYGFYWEDDSDKPILIIRIKPPNEHLQELVCDWAASLASVMKYAENHGGPLLTWEVVFSKKSDNRWKVVFDFTGNEYLEFECSSLGLREV